MRHAKLLIPVILAVVLGCDWFEGQPEANLPPETELLACAPADGVTEGDDVRFVWTGTDIDGHVVGYDLSYDGGQWEATSKDSAVISDVTPGSHTFEVRAVDDDGDVDPDPAVCSFTASMAGRLVDRAVLVELFTTNECPNCPKAETALNAVLADMGLRAVSIVAYHDKPSYSPDSDPLATSQTDERIGWYTDNPAFPVDDDTWPTVVFDGLRVVVGALTAEQAEANYRLEISARAEAGSPLSLRLEGDIGSEQGNVEVVARAEDVPAGGSPVLRLVVIENNVKYRGYWATRYGYVARLLLDDEPLSLTAVGDSVSVQIDFEMDPSWVVENLDVIAFVQDTETLEVIQSGRLRGE
jgi:hypothetical protein